MGREIRRVPLGYSFPLNQSAADVMYNAHRLGCDKPDHDDCQYPDWRAIIPKGEGWQLWQTVSDGPLSPVFATPEELIDWMCQPDPKLGSSERYSPWGQGWSREVAEPFVRKQMSAPSFVTGPGGITDGATWAVEQAKKNAAP